MTLSLEDVEAGKFGKPVDGEDLSVANVTITSKLTRPPHSVIRLAADAGSTIRYRVAYNPFKDGDFELIHTTWGKDANGDWDVEGNQLLKGGPWREDGPVIGAVTLNKTSPLFGVRDAKLSHGNANTKFWANADKWPLVSAGAYILGFAYKNSNAANTMDYAISYLNSAGVRKWLQAGGNWDAAGHWFTAAGSAVLAYIVKAFTTEAAAIHSVWFRPTGAVAETTQIDQVFFAETALSEDAHHPGGPELVIFEHEGRISAISADAGPQNLNIATMK